MARGAVPEEELEEYYTEEKYHEFKMACDEDSPVGCHSLGQWYALIGQDTLQAYRVFTKNCKERQHGNSCLSAGLLRMRAKPKSKSTTEYVEADLFKSYPQALHFFKLACECDPPHQQVR